MTGEHSSTPSIFTRMSGPLLRCDAALILPLSFPEPGLSLPPQVESPASTHVLPRPKVDSPAAKRRTSRPDPLERRGRGTSPAQTPNQRTQAAHDDHRSTAKSASSHGYRATHTCQMTAAHTTRRWASSYAESAFPPPYPAPAPQPSAAAYRHAEAQAAVADAPG